MKQSTLSNDKQCLLTIPVADVLSYYGKHAGHCGDMYRSPFRDENIPSMHVTAFPDGTWVWADFGGSPSPGKHVDGGGILDMVRRLSGLSTNEEAFGVLAEIARNRGIYVSAPDPSVRRTSASREPAIVVDSVSESFSRRSILNYATSVRRIPRDILERYCRQVTYHPVSRPSLHFTVIGFPNNAGGWALRGSRAGDKRNSGWGITTIGADGSVRPDASSSCDRCVLFEGFMDFLSWLAWRGVREPGMDVCVLHSTANVAHAKAFVLSHGVVRTFFDNDRAGTAATESVGGWCSEAGLDFKDGRGAYAGCNDVNEAWVKAVESAFGRDPLHSPRIDGGLRR